MPKKNYKNNAKKSGDEPIYHGHSMSVKFSVLLILLYCITPHGISRSQLQDLLTLDLIALHCMEVHPGLKSLFHFKHFFANRHSKTHFFCVHCLTCMESNAQTCPNR